MSPLTFTERSREGIKRSLIRLEPSVNDCVLWCRRHWDSASRDTRVLTPEGGGARAPGGDHGTGVGPPLPGSTHPARHRRFGGNEAGGEEGDGASVWLAKAGARRYSL